MHYVCTISLAFANMAKSAGNNTSKKSAKIKTAVEMNAGNVIPEFAGISVYSKDVNSGSSVLLTRPEIRRCICTNYNVFNKNE